MRCNWFFLGRDFAIRTVSIEMAISCVPFVFGSRKIRNLQLPYHTNYLLSTRSVLSRPRANIPQYSSSKKLLSFSQFVIWRYSINPAI